MTPAARRIAAAARLDHARNAAALGAAREACIPDAVDRLASVLAGEREAERAGAVRPFVLRLVDGGAA